MREDELQLTPAVARGCRQKSTGTDAQRGHDGSTAWLGFAAKEAGTTAETVM
jgi:hypothetical protein